MNRATFFKHFELVADHPDAVSKMRELVLELAVRGKLVPQNLKDEPAAKLMDRICKEKEKLGTSGKIQKDVLPPVASDETAFDVPPSWCWARTQHVTAYVQRGKSPKYSTEEKVPVIAQKCIQWHGFELHKAQFIEPTSLESYSEERFVLDGDLLWNSTGLGTLGRIIVFKDRFKGVYPRIVADSHVTVIRPSKLVVSDYLFLWFAGPKVQNEINAKASGSTKQTELATSTVLSYAIPLPPLAEQRRIVTKVDELMALCDELEQRQLARQHASGILQQSALHHLLAAREPQTFAAAWQRVRDHFHLLHDTPDALPQLRQAILQLAVQGRLVPQNPKDEDSAGSVERLRQQKAELVSKKRIPKPAEVLPIGEGIVPFDLPKNWIWIRFGELNRKLEYGTSQKGFPNGKGVPVFRMNNIVDGKLLNDNLKYVPTNCPDLPKLFLNDGDILFNRTNSAELVGKAAVFKGESGKFTFASYLIRAVLFQDFAVPDFFNLAINARDFRQTQIEPELTQQCGQANFNGTKLASALVPFPPLAEQKRIVARVEELLRWCDALEAQLHQTRTLGAHLLASTLHHLLAA